MTVLILLISLMVLYFGAEWLVRGGASLALRLGLTPLVVGLTVVAYGTSMPELIVSVRAAMAGQGDIALGNVVGSNLFNIGVILGLSALVYPLRVQFQLIRLDTPVMIGVALMFLYFFRDASISRAEAAIFLTLLMLYSILNLYAARKAATAEVREEFTKTVPKPTGHWAVDLGFIAGGLAMLVVGSRLLVMSSVDLARSWGVGEAVIGLTIVAAGTSMPELATSVVAALKKQPDIAIGNVVGSNIYNILAMLGLSGLAGTLDAPGVRMFDVYVMTGISLLLLPLMWRRLDISRWEGAVLLAAYGGYLWVLWPK